MNQLEQEATEIGLSRGWSHANYVEAYGGDKDEEPEVPARFASVPTYYTAAYAEGVERFENGQYQDGTSRDEDEHPDDCQFCAAGEGSEHNYEPPQR